MLRKAITFGGNLIWDTTVIVAGHVGGACLATGREFVGGLPLLGGAQAQAKFDAVFGGIEAVEPVSHNPSVSVSPGCPVLKAPPPLRHLPNISWIACATMRRSTPQSR